MRIIEKFKTLKEFPDYHIGNEGTIISTKRNRRAVLKGKIDKDGYVEYHLKINKKDCYIRGHRLIALAWIPNPENFPVVNHKDNTKANNCVNNLEWCTVQYNTQYTFDNHGRKGNNGGMNKKVVLCDLEWNEIKEFNSFLDLAKSLSLKGGSASIGAYFNRVKINGDSATISRKYRAKIIE